MFIFLLISNDVHAATNLSNEIGTISYDKLVYNKDGSYLIYILTEDTLPLDSQTTIPSNRDFTLSTVSNSYNKVDTKMYTTMQKKEICYGIIN